MRYYRGQAERLRKGCVQALFGFFDVLRYYSSPVIPVVISGGGEKVSLECVVLGDRLPRSLF